MYYVIALFYININRVVMRNFNVLKRLLMIQKVTRKYHEVTDRILCTLE